MSLWLAEGRSSQKQYFNTTPGATTPTIIEHVMTPVTSRIIWMYSATMLESLVAVTGALVAWRVRRAGGRSPVSIRYEW